MVWLGNEQRSSTPISIPISNLYLLIVMAMYSLLLIQITYILLQERLHISYCISLHILYVEKTLLIQILLLIKIPEEQKFKDEFRELILGFLEWLSKLVRFKYANNFIFHNKESLDSLWHALFVETCLYGLLYNKPHPVSIPLSNLYLLFVMTMYSLLFRNNWTLQGSIPPRWAQ